MQDNKIIDSFRGLNKNWFLTLNYQFSLQNIEIWIITLSYHGDEGMYYTPNVNYCKKKLEESGMEPEASRMRSERSTTELHPLIDSHYDSCQELVASILKIE